RRRVTVTPMLGPWLDAVVSKLGTGHPAHAEFAGLRKQLTVLSDLAKAREQVAGFYKNWYDSISSVPKAGRSMALFQDLAAAYALGKALPPLVGSGTAKRPEAVVEPLMMSCL